MDTYTPRERDLKRANFEMHVRALRRYVEMQRGIYGLEAVQVAEGMYQDGWRVDGRGDLVKVGVK